MDPYEWGKEADVTYTPVWTGNIALDEKMTGPTDIYGITGIDPDEWQIIGLDLGGGETQLDTHVIAVHRSEVGDQHLSTQSEINAVDILVHGVDPFALLRELTHMLEIRMRVQAVNDAKITITKLADQPRQE